MMQEAYAEDPELRSKLVIAFVTGGYADAVSYQIGEFVPTALRFQISAAAAFFGLFLIGLVAGRKKILVEAAGNQRKMVRMLVGCGVIGLVGNFFGACGMMVGSAGRDHAFSFAGTTAISGFGPVFAAAYVAGTLLWIQREGSLGFLCPMASAPALSGAT